MRKIMESIRKFLEDRQRECFVYFVVGGIVMATLLWTFTLFGMPPLGWENYVYHNVDKVEELMAEFMSVIWENTDK